MLEEYSELGKLHFENLPFYIGMQDSPTILDFPHSLPFTLGFDDDLGLIVQKSNSCIDEWLQKAYTYGSSLSTPIGEGSFGRDLAEDVIRNLQDSLSSRRIRGHSFLEVGCNKGYLLYMLKCMGAARCLGIDPDPNSGIGAEKYGVDIVQGFFHPETMKEKFDVVFSYGVVEHMDNPLAFLKGLKDCTKENGIVFTAVPNCELGLSIGDPSLLGHEHYNYFTIQSLQNLYRRLGLGSIQCKNARQGWMLYMSGSVIADSAVVERSSRDDTMQEKRLYRNYIQSCQALTQKMQEKITHHENNHRSIGIYGALPYLLLFDWKKQPRFFDGDTAKHGKFLPGCNNPIEAPDSLINNPVDSIWIAPINHDLEIRRFLENELKIDPAIIYSLINIFD